MSKRDQQQKRSAFARRVRQILPTYTFEIAPLERRQMLCGSHELATGDITHYDAPPPTDGPKLFAAAEPEAAAVAAVTDTTAAGLPLLSSNPSARAKLFLDFDGSPINSMLPYDNDGNSAAFTAGEAANIVEMWQRTSEKFAPFDLDVTTIDPGPSKARESGFVTISRNQSTGGYAYVNVFGSGSMWGVVNVNPFTSNKIAADIIVHEAGHLLGLWHQSLYDAAGNKLQEYFIGDSQRAPIMGNLYYAQRALWWNGPSSLGPNANQDDLAILSGKYNAFGYRPDDHGNTFELADTLTLAPGETTLSGSGLIETVADTDVFGFFASGGEIEFSVNITPHSPSLDAALYLYRSQDGEPYELVASAATSELSESLSFFADQSGYYRLVVASQGGYGDIGQYTINGVAPLSSTGVESASLVSATIVSSNRVDITWLDNADNETGHTVQRTSDGGATWQTIATLGADTSGYSDTGVAAGNVYHYRVLTIGSVATAEPSNIARAALVAGPANARATSVGYTRATLAWNAAPGAVGYLIEKSSDGGATWSHVAVAAGTATTFQVSGLAVDTDYQFRVRSKDRAYSLPGDTIAVHTQFLAAPAAPNPVTAAAANAYAVDVTWVDVAGEDRYEVERSTDGVTWVSAGSTPAGTTSLHDYNYTPDTLWHYRVAGVNEAGRGAWSDVVTARTHVLTAPQAPTNLHILEHYGNEYFVLHWDDSDDTADDYNVERLENGAWVFVGNAGDPDQPYFWTGQLQANTSYTYRVKGVNGSGESAPSNEVNFVAPPDMPANFRVTSAPSADEIHLAWDDVAGEVAYRLERDFQDYGEWQTIAFLDAGATSFIDSGLVENEWYTYRIVATNGQYESAASHISFTAPAGVPAAPTGLTATPSTSYRAIELTWADVSFETTYKLERSLNGTDGWTHIATTAADQTSHTDYGRTPGIAYYYRVKANNLAGDSAPSSVASATAVLPAVPAAPSELAHVSSTTGEITFEWTDNSDNETGFVIEKLFYDPWEGYWYFEPYETVEPGTNSFTDGGFYAGDSTSYRVRAINDGGSSAYSNQLDTQTRPDAPSPFNASAVASNQVNLTWSAMNGANGYRVERSLTGSGNWSLLATPAAGVTSFSDTTVSANVKYYYRVTATSPVGNSASSVIVNVTTPQLNVPATPSGLATSVASSSQISLSWTDVAGETSYTIQRSADNVTFTNHATAGANVTTINDASLSSGTRYYYRVLASNAAGSSAPSAAVNGITLTAAPAGLTATPVSATRVDLAWSTVTGNDGFRVERSSDGGANWTLLGSTGTNVTTYSDTTAAAGTSYAYRVNGFNASGNSAPSSTATALTVPLAPSGLVASAASSSQITLTWTGVSGETGYVIERSANGGSTWTQAGATAAGVTTFNDASLTAATAYVYRVRATNATGASANSATAAATTRTLAPTGLAASAASSSQVNLTWADVAGETSYIVERSANGSTGWAQVGTAAANATSFSNTGLAASTTYFYRVIAVNAGGNSLPSATASATTQAAVPAAASNLVATALSRTSIRLDWADNSTNETGFRIERSLNGTTGWSTVTTVGAGVTTYTNTGLTRNTRYYYRIVAINAAGSAALSNVANAITPK